MRDFELDDQFWRDALAALQAGEPVEALSGRYPQYTDLIGELALDATGEPILIGFRHAAADENPRLLALLSAAFLARGGRRTLLLDLDPEVRWLEQVLGGDFKEGVVDHLQFGIPIERCIRPTAVAGLEAMSGGAAFLAGSPLDDPPRFRAALFALKRGRDAVVVALPPPAESADGSGVPTLCDAVVTIEDTEGPARPLGTERAIVRLSGDPRAARELARLCHRFLGPLPALLTSPGAPTRASAPPPAAEPFWAATGDASADSAHVSEELDFLSAFEGRPAPSAEPALAETRRVRLDEVVEASRAKSEARRTSRPTRGRRRPLDRRVLTLATVMLAAIAALALGSRWFAPLFAGWSGGDLESVYEGSGASPTVGGEPGTVIPLSGPVVRTPGDSAAAELAAADSAAADSTPAGGGASATAASAPGKPAPYSVHVGSYRTAEAARGVVRDLARVGMTAFLSPVVLPEKGEWVRVYVGAFGDSGEARATLSELTSGGVVKDGAVRDTPLAFLLGVYPTSEEADRRISELAARGIPAYALGDGPVRVWAGAFQNEAESRLLASALDAESSPETIRLSRRER
ncbi:MAG: SPOR domain-containing protein [Gemmatimonadota bacterium]